MRKYAGLAAAAMFGISVILSGCGTDPQLQSETETGAEVTSHQVEPVTQTSPVASWETGPQIGPGTTGEAKNGGPKTEDMVSPEGMTLETRILPPAGYQRTPALSGSFQEYLRTYSMKVHNSPVLLYDGREKGNQQAQAAVFELPNFSSDLQQCADSLMRMYGEYFWAAEAYDKIAFHLTNGFLMDYPSWRSGKRLSVNGNQTSWVKKAGEDGSYETFLQYMKMVMSYAGTLSLDQESAKIDIKEIKAGDMFIKGGSPGHCVMVADTAVDESGRLCFLLAQGYMPAQDFHVLKNPLHEEDPWYYEEEVTYPLFTPEYTFQEGSLKRWFGFAD